MGGIATVDGARRVSQAALEQPRAETRGAVLEPGDEGDREVREAFNAMHPSTPAVTVRCDGTADVIAAVRFAREERLPLAVRGGGHSIAGLSSIDGGVLLDLAPMRGVVVDADRRLAIVQGGALWADVDRETQAFGLVAPGGVVSDTGVAGLTLGGGYGWVRRKYGLSVDALVEAQIVCADGRVRTASADSHPDLYWAIRGGGANFGVVTSFTFALQPLGPTVAFAATFYPLEEIAEILRSWRAYVERAPDEVTSVVVTMTFPADPELPEAIHDREVAIVGGVYAGHADEGLDAMAPLRALGTPLLDMSGPTPFSAVQTGFDPLFPRNELRAYWKSQYLDELSDATIDLIADRARNRPRAADAGQHLPYGRRHRSRRPRGDRLRAALGPVHGLPRRDVDRPGRRRRQDRVGALGVGRGRRVRQRGRVPELHRTRRRGRRRERGERVRAQPRAPGEGQGRLRPREPLPDQQQHPTRLRGATMLCAHTVRRLKHGTFDQFHEAFRPPAEAPPEGWVRFHLLRSRGDENAVVTFGFFDGSIEELERSQEDSDYDSRRQAVEPFVDRVIANGVYEVVESWTAEGIAA